MCYPFSVVPASSTLHQDGVVPNPSQQLSPPSSKIQDTVDACGISMELCGTRRHHLGLQLLVWLCSIMHWRSQRSDPISWLEKLLNNQIILTRCQPYIVPLTQLWIPLWCAPSILQVQSYSRSFSRVMKSKIKRRGVKNLNFIFESILHHPPRKDHRLIPSKRILKRKEGKSISINDVIDPQTKEKQANK